MVEKNAAQFKKTPAVLAKQFHSDCTAGLSTTQHATNLVAAGQNVLQAAPRPSLFKRIAHHLKDITSLVLLFAVALSVYLAAATDAGWGKPLIIAGIVALNVAISVIQEGRAEQALSSLKAMNTHVVTVIRDGARQPVEAESLAPGDVIVVKAGDAIAADARLITATALAVDEAVLTGESEPVTKDTTSAPALFAGTAVVGGTATAIVVGTGMTTELGAIATMLNTTKNVTTPLTQRLNALAKRLSAVAIIGGMVTVALAVWLHGEAPATGVMIGIGLAIAAVPESLPVIVTLSLTHGVHRMAKQYAIIRQLTAVETIGNVTVIASDKTGTLTENRMTVTHFWPNHGDPIALTEAQTAKLPATTLPFWALASEATLGTPTVPASGTPTDLAVLRFAAATSDVTATAKRYPQVAAIPFDSNHKYSDPAPRRGRLRSGGQGRDGSA